MEQEIWKIIPMYPTYEASNLGRIRNKKRGTIMKQLSSDIRGYQRVSLSYRNKPYTRKVARLVWSAFNGCDCEFFIDHKDNNVFNNNIENLQCITPKQNSLKRTIYGNKLNRYDLDDEKRKEIITSIREGSKTVWQISKEYRIPPNYLYTTLQRKSWDHLWTKENTENTENSQGQ